MAVFIESVNYWSIIFGHISTPPVWSSASRASKHNVWAEFHTSWGNYFFSTKQFFSNDFLRKEETIKNCPIGIFFCLSGINLNNDLGKNNNCQFGGKTKQSKLIELKLGMSLFGKSPPILSLFSLFAYLWSCCKLNRAPSAIDAAYCPGF